MYMSFLCRFCLYVFFMVVFFVVLCIPFFFLLCCYFFPLFIFSAFCFISHLFPEYGYEQLHSKSYLVAFILFIQIHTKNRARIQHPLYNRIAIKQDISMPVGKRTQAILLVPTGLVWHSWNKHVDKE